MKVLVTGGGTGGHIYPAIAIADKIKRKRKDAEILFVGTKRGMEKDLVPNHGYPIRFITASGIDRKHWHRNFKTMRDVIRGYQETKQILDAFQPDLVIGTGGYVCGPVIRAAHKKGIPTFIHEQNALPGLTNRLLERYVEKVFISFPESAKYFKRKDKLVVSGNPIRKEFLVAGLTDHRQNLGIDPKDFVILSFGGSLGAAKINQTMMEVATFLTQVPNLRLYFITGKNQYDTIRSRLEGEGIYDGETIHLLPYAENLYEYLLASDLVISRAGALTVSELTACAKPSILIPSPNVTGNHQYYNAKVLADKGGAVLLEEKELTGESLTRSIMRFWNNRDALNAMAKASGAMGRLDGADVIFDHLGLR